MHPFRTYVKTGRAKARLVSTLATEKRLKLGYRRMADFRPKIWNGEPIPYHETVEVLRSLIGTYGKAGPAIRALAEHPDPDALATLIELAHSRDPYLRASALEAIGCHRTGRDVAKVLVSSLDYSNGFVVRAAARAAAALGLTAAHDRILELVGAEEEATRLSALAALQSLWQPSDFEAVFARYLSDPSDRVRKQAAWTLEKNVGSDHWERVFDAWSADRIPRHRAWACSIAEKFGTKAILAKLVGLCSDPDGHVRRAAERAVKAVGTS
jgi:HEAT repeat protein